MSETLLKVEVGASTIEIKTTQNDNVLEVTDTTDYGSKIQEQLRQIGAERAPLDMHPGLAIPQE